MGAPKLELTRGRFDSDSHDKGIDRPIARLWLDSEVDAPTLCLAAQAVAAFCEHR